MKKVSYFSQQLAAIEPTLEIEKDWQASFQLGGFRCHAALVADEWLVTTIHFLGDTDALLAMQTAIEGLAKITAGPELRVDVPIDTDVEESFALARQEILEALRGISGKPREVAKGADCQALRQQIEEHLGSTQREWSADEQGFVMGVNSKQLSQKVWVKIDAEVIHCYADIVRLRDLKSVSRRALAHCLLALNQNHWLVRGQLLEDCVRLEVFIPATAFSPALFERAIKAISAGVALAKRECAALLLEDVARIYCDFHTRQAEALGATTTGLTQSAREGQQTGI